MSAGEMAIDTTGVAHEVAREAPEPDRKRPGFRDPRVVVMTCGRIGVLGGRPRQPRTGCRSCYPIAP